MEDNKDIINDTFKSFDESSLESELEYIDNFLDNKEEPKEKLSLIDKIKKWFND